MFNLFVNQILVNEGGYTNNAADKGGETKYGITAATAKSNGYTGSISELPQNVAINIYRLNYWAKIKGDELPKKTAFLAFDFAVNAGTARAAVQLQAAINKCGGGLKIDGIVGKKTIAAAAVAADILPYAFAGQVLNYYASLGQWSTFGRGWTRRVANNLLFLSSMKDE